MLAQRPSFRVIVTAGAVASLILFTFLLFLGRGPRDISSKYVLKTPYKPVKEKPTKECPSPAPVHNETWQFQTERDALNYGLSEEQCLSAFPKLFFEIDKSVAQRQQHITFAELESRTVEDNQARVIVHKGEVYIVEFGEMTNTASRARATLLALQRALEAVPDRHLLPSIEFFFTASDWPHDPESGPPIFSYTKRDAHNATWLMPDFGYYSWPEASISTYNEARRRMIEIDEGEINADGTRSPGLAFQDKKKQLIWRGNVDTNKEIRGKLVEASQGQSWASVHHFVWGKDEVLPLEDHCRYMFAAQTEGHTYSGRGKYLLNCRMVLVAHSMIWREAHHAAMIASGPEANYVEVGSDYSDLPRKMEFLIDNPEVAQRIADNAVRTFRDRYITPAAEACYWRHLIRKYASVCDFKPSLTQIKDGKKVPRAIHLEDWLLLKTMMKTDTQQKKKIENIKTENTKTENTKTENTKTENTQNKEQT